VRLSNTIRFGDALGVVLMPRVGRDAFAEFAWFARIELLSPIRLPQPSTSHQLEFQGVL
jgi:hypothetical protein